MPEFCQDHVGNHVFRGISHNPRDFPVPALDISPHVGDNRSMRNEATTNAKGKTMKTAAKQFISDVVGKNGAAQIGSHCVIGYVSAQHSAYARLTAGRIPKSGRSPLGLLIRESMERHPDSLSVTGGIWQHSTDTEAPSQQWVFVVAGDDGMPDITHLCRDGGAAEKLVRGMM